MKSILPAKVRRFAVNKSLLLSQFDYNVSPTGWQNRSALQRLGNQYSDKTAVILGNGPSMRGFDLAQLDGLPCFCLNRGYLLWNDQHRSPEFLVVVNNLVISQFYNELSAVKAKAFAPWQFREFFVSDTLFFKERWEERFFRDVTRGVWFGGTVTFVALQLAYFLGFSKVVLLGIDHKFTFDGAPNTELLSSSDDPNHFSPDYFGPGVRWHAPDLQRSEQSYRLARACYEADGRRIIDATSGGACPVFERQPLGDALADDR